MRFRNKYRTDFLRLLSGHSLDKMQADLAVVLALPAVLMLPVLQAVAAALSLIILQFLQTESDILAAVLAVAALAVLGDLAVAALDEPDMLD